MGVILNGLMVSADDAFMSFEDFVASLQLDRETERDSRPDRSDPTASPTRAAVDPVVQ